MNKTFSKKSRINLDENWFLTSDGDNGVVLTFHEPRKKELIKKVEGKTVKTGVIEDYLFEDKWYTTRLSQALKIYCEKTENNSNSLKELVDNYSKLYEIISNLDKEFRQYE